MSAYNGIHDTVAKQVTRLDDAISTRERNTSNGYTVIIVPSNPSEQIFMSLDGKPVNADIEDVLGAALGLRSEASGR